MIYLLRHGLDDEGYIGGYSDVSLTPEGRNQVLKARDFILEHNFNIKKIYSSDVRRARETTDIINEKLGLEVCYLSEIRELDKGLLTGLKKTEAYKKFPDYMDFSDVTIRYPNGESMQDLYDRVVDYMSKFSDDNCLLVTHRGVINMLYYHYNNIPLSMDKKRFGVTHASIHTFDKEKGEIKKIF